MTIINRQCIKSSSKESIHVVEAHGRITRVIFLGGSLPEDQNVSMAKQLSDAEIEGLIKAIEKIIDLYERDKKNLL